jgi:hypothetical protein
MLHSSGIANLNLATGWQVLTKRSWGVPQPESVRFSRMNFCIKQYYGIYSMVDILSTADKNQIMDLQTLSEQCRQDTIQYKRSAAAPSNNCFELMRRALADDNNQALTYLYVNYRQLILNWIHQHPGFAATGEEADYFMSGAFANFYFALRKDRFQKFATLAQALQYLKACVHTIIMQYIRKHRLAYTALDDDWTTGTEPDFDQIFRIGAIWERICQLLPNEQDQKLAHLLFVQDRKPAEIAAAFPDEYDTPRSVSIGRQRIVRTLREDDKLRELLGASAKPLS